MFVSKFEPKCWLETTAAVKLLKCFIRQENTFCCCLKYLFVAVIIDQCLCALVCAGVLLLKKQDSSTLFRL